MPALGFGTLSPDTAVTKTAIRKALDAGDTLIPRSDTGTSVGRHRDGLHFRHLFR
jgi:diketogulonate reductase-like aldo/keto reductase